MKKSERWVESVHFKPLKLECSLFPNKGICSTHTPIISTSLGRYFTPQRLRFTGGSSLSFYGNPSSLWLLFLSKSDLSCQISQDQPLRPSVAFSKERNPDLFLTLGQKVWTWTCWAVQKFLPRGTPAGASTSDLGRRQWCGRLQCLG